MTREEMAPCPFPDCGEPCCLVDDSSGPFVRCYSCTYRSIDHGSVARTIAAHNRVATAIPRERVREVFGSLARELRKAGEDVRAIDVEDGMRELGIDLEGDDDN